MSCTQFHCIKMFILRHAWLNLWDKHMTTGRINQVTSIKWIDIKLNSLLSVPTHNKKQIMLLPPRVSQIIPTHSPFPIRRSVSVSYDSLQTDLKNLINCSSEQNDDQNRVRKMKSTLHSERKAIEWVSVWNVIPVIRFLMKKSNN
jgi:hypothetical protein